MSTEITSLAICLNDTWIKKTCIVLFGLYTYRLSILRGVLLYSMIQEKNLRKESMSSTDQVTWTMTPYKAI